MTVSLSTVRVQAIDFDLHGGRMRTLLGSALLLYAAYAGFHVIGSGRTPEHATAAAGNSGCTEAVLLRSTGRIMLTSCPPPGTGADTQTAELP